MQRDEATENTALLRRRAYIVWGCIVGIVGSTVLLPYMPWRRATDPILQCDLAIQATLKAPSTYERIVVSGGAPTFYVTYEAQNSFGVPLRSSGVCEVAHNTAIWRQDEIPF